MLTSLGGHQSKIYQSSTCCSNWFRGNLSSWQDKINCKQNPGSWALILDHSDGCKTRESHDDGDIRVWCLWLNCFLKCRLQHYSKPEPTLSDNSEKTNKITRKIFTMCAHFSAMLKDSRRIAINGWARKPTIRVASSITAVHWSCCRFLTFVITNRVCPAKTLGISNFKTRFSSF